MESIRSRNSEYFIRSLLEASFHHISSLRSLRPPAIPAPTKGTQSVQYVCQIGPSRKLSTFSLVRSRGLRSATYWRHLQRPASSSGLRTSSACFTPPEYSPSRLLVWPCLQWAASDGWADRC